MQHRAAPGQLASVRALVPLLAIEIGVEVIIIPIMLAG
jgi:hypothetical protein